MIQEDVWKLYMYAMLLITCQGLTIRDICRDESYEES